MKLGEAFKLPAEGKNKQQIFNRCIKKRQLCCCRAIVRTNILKVCQGSRYCLLLRNKFFKNTTRNMPPKAKGIADRYIHFLCFGFS